MQPASTGEIHPQSILGRKMSEAAEQATQILAPHLTVVEVVTYDPEDFDTYPSVCSTAADVERRFNFTGGEKLVFTADGLYIGRLTDQLEEAE